MSDEDSDNDMRDPYRDDLVWEDWHAQAHGVQGGVDDSSSSESEDANSDFVPVTLPTTCLCQHCRLACTLFGGGQRVDMMEAGRIILTVPDRHLSPFPISEITY